MYCTSNKLTDVLLNNTNIMNIQFFNHKANNQSLNPNLSHKEIFRSCALSWKDAIENPKNQK